MEENSTTPPADDPQTQPPADAPADPKAGTENQTPKTGDDLDTSQSADKPADGDKKPEEGADDKTKTPASQFDPDLDEWAVKTGRETPTTDAERTLLQEIRNNRRDFNRENQAKKANAEMHKALQDAKPDAANKTGDDDDDQGDPLEGKVSSLEEQLAEERNLRQRSEYFSANEVSTEQVKAMGEILKEKVDRASTPEQKAQVYKYWTDPVNLEDWHALAKARLATATDTTDIEEEAARKERERIAKESKANGPNRNASSPSTSDKTEEQARLERFKKWD